MKYIHYNIYIYIYIYTYIYNNAHTLQQYDIFGSEFTGRSGVAGHH